MTWEDSRIRDGVRDSKILWDAPSKFDQKFDDFAMEISRDYCQQAGRVFPRTQFGEINECYERRQTRRSESEYPEYGSTEKSLFNQQTHREFTLPESQAFDPKVKLPTFDGSSLTLDFLDWIDTFEDYFEAVNPPDAVKCKLAAFKLKGEACVWWKGLQNHRFLEGKNSITSWTRMRELLIEKYLHTSCLTYFHKQKNEGNLEHTNCLIKVPSESHSSKPVMNEADIYVTEDELAESVDQVDESLEANGSSNMVHKSVLLERFDSKLVEPEHKAVSISNTLLYIDSVELFHLPKLPTSNLLFQYIILHDGNLSFMFDPGGMWKWHSDTGRRQLKFVCFCPSWSMSIEEYQEIEGDGSWKLKTPSPVDVAKPFNFGSDLQNVCSWRHCFQRVFQRLKLSPSLTCPVADFLSNLSPTISLRSHCKKPWTSIWANLLESDFVFGMLSMVMANKIPITLGPSHSLLLQGLLCVNYVYHMSLHIDPEVIMQLVSKVTDTLTSTRGLVDLTRYWRIGFIWRANTRVGYTNAIWHGYTNAIWHSVRGRETRFVFQSFYLKRSLYLSKAWDSRNHVPPKRNEIALLVFDPGGCPNYQRCGEAGIIAAVILEELITVLSESNISVQALVIHGYIRTRTHIYSNANAWLNSKKNDSKTTIIVFRCILNHSPTVPLTDHPLSLSLKVVEVYVLRLQAGVCTAEQKVCHPIVLVENERDIIIANGKTNFDTLSPFLESYATFVLPPTLRYKWDDVKKDCNKASDQILNGASTDPSTVEWLYCHLVSAIEFSLWKLIWVHFVLWSSLLVISLYCGAYNYKLTRGRVIPLEGWNIKNNANMENKFIVVETSVIIMDSYGIVLWKNGQTRKSLKLFHDVVNGLDPPIDLDGACRTLRK